MEGFLITNLRKGVEKKAELFDNSIARYMVRSLLACLFLTLGVSIASFIGGKADDIVMGSGRFFFAFMFSWSLVMIIYMNAELGTSNMMYMTMAMHRKWLKPSKALKILFTCILCNAIGAVIVSYVVAHTLAYDHLETGHYLFTAAIGKFEKTPIEQFSEGIFANIIVNIAVFVNIRMKDDAGKVIATIFIIFIFAFLGFEHVIANFSTFSLAYFANHGPVEGMTVMSVLSNFFYSGLGNYVGGGLVIGLLYSWLNDKSELYLD